MNHYFKKKMALHENTIVTYCTNTLPFSAPIDLTPISSERPPGWQPPRSIGRRTQAGVLTIRAPDLLVTYYLLYRRSSLSSFCPAILAHVPHFFWGSMSILLAPDGNRPIHSDWIIKLIVFRGVRVYQTLCSQNLGAFCLGGLCPFLLCRRPTSSGFPPLGLVSLNSHSSL